MTQRYIHADKDVTVAFVYDRLFAFELDRSSFREQTADWREMPTDWERAKWRPHPLPDSVAHGIFGFMKELGLHFGRLDFLLGPEGYHFLEVNSNGEWAWLDTDGQFCLFGLCGNDLSTCSAASREVRPIKGLNMRLIAMLCLSLLILPSIAYAWAWKGKEKVINDAIGRAIGEGYDNNFQKAAAECEKVRSVAGSDNFLLGMVEMCLGEVESFQGAAHVPPTCKHYSRAIALWQLTPPPATGDVEQTGKRREWTQIMDMFRKRNHCI
jgi:hypothetical protein